MPLADPLSQVLLALAAVLVAGAVLGRLLRTIGQPPVIAEIVAGLALGPSLLGPKFSAVLLPPTALPALEVLAQLGIVLYLFTVGQELELERLQRQKKALIAVTLASLMVPFLMGMALTPALFPALAGARATPLTLGLFLGIALAITAFPVLARLLSERGLMQSEGGVLSLTSAAIGDVLAWVALAFVVGSLTAQVGAGVRVVLGTAIYLFVLFGVVRPLVRRWQTTPPIALIGLLLSALATEQIGIHALSGAFLWGMVLPPRHPGVQALVRQLQPITTYLLLPAFFALTGMRTRIDLLGGAGTWLTCLAIIAVATLGKVGGTFLGARLAGLGNRDALALGALMNTRGLIELIVLNIGLEKGVLSPTLFAMLVVMALVTTMMTAPLLQWLLPDSEKNTLWQPPA
jgi:Kef-type K+ transport system membrane component KefB